MAPSANTLMTDTSTQWPSVPSSSGPPSQGSRQSGNRAEAANNLWVRTGYRNGKQTARPLIIASWNVRTLLDRTEANRPERRTALVTRELSRYGVDIAALSETRFLDQGQLREIGSGYTIFWSGRKPKGINDRIMSTRSVYAPTINDEP